MEHRYSTAEKEALACVWAVEKFEKFLLSRHFTLHMDQHALHQILSSPSKAVGIRKTLKFIRWAELLSAYDFDIAYQKGEENLVPNALSCLPLPSQANALEDHEHD